MENRQSDPNNATSSLRRAAAGIILLFAAGVFGVLTFFAIRYFGLKPVVVWEYGEGIPEISEFARNTAASYIDPPAAKPQKGWHAIEIEANGGRRTVWLYICDTKAPTALPVEKTISTLVTLQPDELITNLKDADRVKVLYETTPPFGTVGDCEATVLLEDASGNRSSVTSLLHIRILSEEGVTVEAGSDAPPARAFLTDDYVPEQMTEITDGMLHTPGTYPIGFTIDGEHMTASLTVVDTVAPVVRAQTLFWEPEEPLTAKDFLIEIDDETETTAVFLTEPDKTDRNFQSVSIRVTDAGGNETDVSAGLLFTHTQPIVIEARKTKLTAAECLEGVEYDDAVLIKDFIPDEIGMYAVSVQVDGKPELALVEVRDTTPPLVTGGTVKGYLHHSLAPKSICTIEDATETSAVYAEEPDWTNPDPQEVTILVTDAAGNESGTTVQMILAPDTTPPELYGIKTRYYYLDEAITYLEGVAAIDNADGELPVSVDTSSVNPNKTGHYSVVYSATDAAGNSTSKRATIWIKKSKVNTDKLDKYVQRIMADITTEDMTLADKVYAIYDYVFTHVRYTSRSDKTDWRKEALRGIQKGKGDCYTSNSLARALLESTEAEIFIMQRKSFNTHHYWLLVNIGTGWYHFDATNSREHGYKCCMWTDAQCSVMKRFWGYDVHATPPVATERFDKAKAAAVEADWVAQHSTGNTIDPYDDELLAAETEDTNAAPGENGTEIQTNENNPGVS